MNKCFFTHTNERYEHVVLNLCKSITKFSNYKLIVYTINYDGSEELKKYAQCIRLDLKVNNENENFIKIYQKDNWYVDRKQEETYWLLSSKVDVLYHACKELNIDEWVYLDGDCIVNHNVDDLFNYMGNVKDYPVASLGPNEYLLLVENGEIIGNPFWREDGSVDLENTLEWPLMNIMGMSPKDRKDYRTTNIILGKKENLDFIKLWLDTKNFFGNIDSLRRQCHFHEETLYNILTWRYNYKTDIPMLYVNIIGHEDVKHFFNTNVEVDTNFSDHYRLPKNKNVIKVFHGEKRKEEANLIMDLIEKNKPENKRVLFLAPHLSTGGMPQFLLKRIECLKEYDSNIQISVVEYSNFSDEYVVQKNKIIDLIGVDNFFTLGEDKSELLNIIQKNNIDIIHIDEIPEGFESFNRIPRDVLDKLYADDRTWKIVETCHNVIFNYDTSKIYEPDAYAFCSNWHPNITFFNAKAYNKVIEYPYENKKPSLEEKIKYREELGFNPDKKHVINVGLWTRGKNQGEAVEIAKLLEKTHPDIEFHFIGNQAPNFKDYWFEISRSLPSNVKIWGERDDVYKFMAAADMFMFNSTFECNPIVVREAISHSLPILARNLTEYMGMFDGYLIEINDNIEESAEKLVNNIYLDKDLGVLDGQMEFAKMHVNLYETIMQTESKPSLIDRSEFIYKNPNIRFFNILEPYIELTFDDGETYNVKVFDENNNLYYENDICSNCWIKLSRKYYTPWKLVVSKNGNEIYTELLSFKGKRVFICFDSFSLGDTIAWMPYCEEFRKKHDCQVIVSCKWIDFFRNTYPNIEFVEPGSTVHNIHGQYLLGWYWNSDYEPEEPNTIPLQKAASNILGLDYVEIKPEIDFTPKERPYAEKYITIATNSTAGCKFWTREGWEAFARYFTDLGYKIINVSKEKENYRNIEQITDTDIWHTMNVIHHSEIFVGLSSGLSWLAWAINKKVVMISNFTEQGHEFTSNCIRIVDKNVCNSCWNNPNYRFDKGDWNWCPVHKGTERQFECQRSITSPTVINAVIGELNGQNIKNEDAFDWGKLGENNLILKEIFQDKIYERFFNVEQGDIVVDIGSSVGPFAFSVSDRAKHTYCLEPSIKLYRTLLKNMIGKSATCLNLGIGKVNGIATSEYIFDEDKEMVSITFSEFAKKYIERDTLNTNGKIDFLKVDCEGGEYLIFTEENINWIKNNVKKIAGEWHIGPEFKEDFRFFRDNILTKFENYEVLTTNFVDIKPSLFSEEFLDYYTEILIYIKNY
jgi:autotransporter strand-loop-strand O-heptosyltransferase